MELWMNEVYDRTKEPTINMFVKWTYDYVANQNPYMIFSMIALLVLFMVLYSVLMKNALKAVLILGIIATISFCAYYVAIFQPSYPKEQVVKALNSSEATSFLANMQLQQKEIRGVMVKDVDFNVVQREDVSFIGHVDKERLKAVTFNIKEDGVTTQYQGYAYVEKAPPGTKQNYVEFYEMDEDKILPQILTEDFFDIKMYNMTIYQK